MARDKLTPIQLSRNAGIDAKAATVLTAINVTNGAYIDASALETDRVILHVKNTEGSTNTVTVKAGAFARGVLGDLVVTVAATSGEQMLHLETSRFKKADGTIDIDFESGMTGLIGVYALP